jgi:hypothetical protein
MMVGFVPGKPDGVRLLAKLTERPLVAIDQREVSAGAPARADVADPDAAQLSWVDQSWQWSLLGTHDGIPTIFGRSPHRRPVLPPTNHLCHTSPRLRKSAAS